MFLAICLWSAFWVIVWGHAVRDNHDPYTKFTVLWGATLLCLLMIALGWLLYLPYRLYGGPL